MAKQVPQKKTFNFVIQLDSVDKWLIWLILLMSVIPLFVTKKDAQWILDFFEWLLIILIPAEFVLSIIKSHYLLPKAERERRYDALDNAFGAKFSLQSSIEYFTNDEIPTGVKKLGVNLFQNVFYTTRLSDRMMVRYFVKSSIFGITIIAMGIYGLKNSPIMLPFLQFMFSATVFGDLIKFLMYHRENNRILEEIKVSFQNSPNDSTILKEYFDYETNISWGQVLISNRVYTKYNDALEKEWQQVKTKYNLNGK